MIKKYSFHNLIKEVRIRQLRTLIGIAIKFSMKIIMAIEINT